MCVADSVAHGSNDEEVLHLQKQLNHVDSVHAGDESELQSAIMQEAGQQKKPKGKRRLLQQTSWGMLGQALPYDSSVKSQHRSAEQQRCAAHSAVKSKSPRDSGDATGGDVAMGGDVADPNIEPAVAHAGDPFRDAPVQKGVQCHGLLPAGVLNNN